MSNAHSKLQYGEPLKNIEISLRPQLFF